MTRYVPGFVICAIVLLGASPRAQSISVPEATPSTPIGASAQKADPVWDGALWGVTIGVVTGTATLPGYLLYDAVGAHRCRTGPRIQCAAAMGAVFGGVGLLIDWLRNGQPGLSRQPARRKTIVRVSPEVAPNHRAIRIDVRVLMDGAGRD